MRVFLSWSGSRSKELAEFLNEWLPRVIQAVDPWMSEEISKGDRWQYVMDESLENTHFGIFCLTPENLNEPWINFEAGAITKQVRESRGWTLLIDLEADNVPPPLGKFQHTRLVREDVRRLLGAINKALAGAEEKPLPDTRLDEIFDKYWPDLEARIAEIVAMPTGQLPAKREPGDVMAEILAIVRRLERQRLLDPASMEKAVGSSLLLAAKRARAGGGATPELIAAALEGLDRNALVPPSQHGGSHAHTPHTDVGE